MTYRALAAALAMVVSCRTAPPPPTPETSSSPDDRRAEIEACILGLYHPMQPELFVEACADLWLAQDCRDGWRAAMSLRADRGEYVIQTCADAYCPTLKPQPALCARQDAPDLLATDPDWMALWTEFNGLALSRDLGLADGDQRGALIARRLLQSVAMSGSESSDGS